MSADTGYSAFEVGTAIERPTAWLSSKLVEVTKPVSDLASQNVETIKISATVVTAANEKTYKVAEWSPSDLYLYSEAPFVELANFFGRLEDHCKRILVSSDDPIEFEMLTVDLWQQILLLNEFLGISASHDEFIANIIAVSRFNYGVLSDDAVRSLIVVFGRLKDVVSFSDEVLDEVYDLLEAVGFDFQVIFEGDE